MLNSEQISKSFKLTSDLIKNVLDCKESLFYQVNDARGEIELVHATANSKADYSTKLGNGFAGVCASKGTLINARNA